MLIEKLMPHEAHGHCTAGMQYARVHMMNLSCYYAHNWVGQASAASRARCAVCWPAHPVSWIVKQSRDRLQPILGSVYVEDVQEDVHSDPR